MSINWTWKELIAFAICIGAGLALVLTHNATWKDLAIFAASSTLFPHAISIGGKSNGPTQP